VQRGQMAVRRTARLNALSADPGTLGGQPVALGVIMVFTINYGEVDVDLPEHCVSQYRS